MGFEGSYDQIGPCNLKELPSCVICIPDFKNSLSRLHEALPNVSHWKYMGRPQIGGLGAKWGEKILGECCDAKRIMRWEAASFGVSLVLLASAVSAVGVSMKKKKARKQATIQKGVTSHHIGDALWEIPQLSPFACGVAVRS